MALRSLNKNVKDFLWFLTNLSFKYILGIVNEEGPVFEAGNIRNHKKYFKFLLNGSQRATKKKKKNHTKKVNLNLFLSSLKFGNFEDDFYQDCGYFIIRIFCELNLYSTLNIL